MTSKDKQELQDSGHECIVIKEEAAEHFYYTSRDPKHTRHRNTQPQYHQSDVKGVLSTSKFTASKASAIASLTGEVVPATGDVTKYTQQQSVHPSAAILSAQVVPPGGGVISVPIQQMLQPSADIKIPIQQMAPPGVPGASVGGSVQTVMQSGETHMTQKLSCGHCEYSTWVYMEMVQHIMQHNVGQVSQTAAVSSPNSRSTTHCGPGSGVSQKSSVPKVDTAQARQMVQLSGQMTPNVQTVSQLPAVSGQSFSAQTPTSAASQGPAVPTPALLSLPLALRTAPQAGSLGSVTATPPTTSVGVSSEAVSQTTQAQPLGTMQQPPIAATFNLSHPAFLGQLLKEPLAALFQNGQLQNMALGQQGVVASVPVTSAHATTLQNVGLPQNGGLTLIPVMSQIATGTSAGQQVLGSLGQHLNLMTMSNAITAQSSPTSTKPLDTVQQQECVAVSMSAPINAGNQQIHSPAQNSHTAPAKGATLEKCAKSNLINVPLSMQKGGTNQVTMLNIPLDLLGEKKIPLQHPLGLAANSVPVSGNGAGVGVNSVPLSSNSTQVAVNSTPADSTGVLQQSRTDDPMATMVAGVAEKSVNLPAGVHVQIPSAHLNGQQMMTVPLLSLISGILQSGAQPANMLPVVGNVQGTPPVMTVPVGEQANKGGSPQVTATQQHGSQQGSVLLNTMTSAGNTLLDGLAANTIPFGSTLQGIMTTNVPPAGSTVQGISTAANMPPAGSTVQGASTAANMPPVGSTLQGTSTASNMAPVGSTLHGTSTVSNMLPVGSISQGILTAANMPSVASVGESTLSAEHFMPIGGITVPCTQKTIGTTNSGERVTQSEAMTKNASKLPAAVADITVTDKNLETLSSRPGVKIATLTASQAITTGTRFNTVNSGVLAIAEQLQPEALSASWDIVTCFMCAKCGYCGRQRDLILQHVRDTHLSLHAFQCALCTQSFQNKEDCVNHAKTVHAGHVTDSNSSGLFTIDNTQQNSLHDDPNSMCEVIKIEPLSIVDGNTQLCIDGGNSRVKYQMFNCDLCNFKHVNVIYTKRHCLGRHFSSCNIFSCVYCSYGTADRLSLTAHVKSDHKDKPFDMKFNSALLAKMTEIVSHCVTESVVDRNELVNILDDFDKIMPRSDVKDCSCDPSIFYEKESLQAEPTVVHKDFSTAVTPVTEKASMLSSQEAANNQQTLGVLFYENASVSPSGQRVVSASRPVAQAASNSSASQSPGNTELGTGQGPSIQTPSNVGVLHNQGKVEAGSISSPSKQTSSHLCTIQNPETIRTVATRASVVQVPSKVCALQNPRDMEPVLTPSLVAETPSIVSAVQNLESKDLTSMQPIHVSPTLQNYNIKSQNQNDGQAIISTVHSSPGVTPMCPRAAANVRPNKRKVREISVNDKKGTDSDEDFRPDDVDLPKRGSQDAESRGQLRPVTRALARAARGEEPAKRPCLCLSESSEDSETVEDCTDDPDPGTVVVMPTTTQIIGTVAPIDEEPQGDLEERRAIQEMYIKQESDTLPSQESIVYHQIPVKEEQVNCVSNMVKTIVISVRDMKDNDITPSDKSTTVFFCAICGVSAPSTEQLRWHISSRHSTLRPYRCSLCQLCLADEQCARQHLIQQHPGVEEVFMKVNIWKAKNQEITVQQQIKMMDVSKLVTGFWRELRVPAFQCGFCIFTHVAEEFVRKHLEMSHCNEIKPVFSCVHCSFGSFKLGIFKLHMEKSHSGTRYNMNYDRDALLNLGNFIRKNIHRVNISSLRALHSCLAVSSEMIEGTDPEATATKWKLKAAATEPNMIMPMQSVHPSDKCVSKTVKKNTVGAIISAKILDSKAQDAACSGGALQLNATNSHDVVHIRDYCSAGVNRHGVATNEETSICGNRSHSGNLNSVPSDQQMAYSCINSGSSGNIQGALADQHMVDISGNKDHSGTPPLPIMLIKNVATGQQNQHENINNHPEHNNIVETCDIHDSSLLHDNSDWEIETEANALEEPSMSDSGISPVEESHDHINKEDCRFECTVCGFRCWYESEMKTHVGHLHTTIAPYSCRHCSFTGYSKEVVRRHIVNEHKNAVLRVNCDEYLCMKLREQMKSIYREVKRLTCPLDTDSDDILHMFGLKNCPKCGQAVRNYHDFVKHVKSAHESGHLEEPYMCQHCPYRSQSPYNLRSHIAELHPGKPLLRPQLVRHLMKMQESNLNMLIDKYISVHIRKVCQGSEYPDAERNMLDHLAKFRASSHAPSRARRKARKPCRKVANESTIDSSEESDTWETYNNGEVPVNWETSDSIQDKSEKYASVHENKPVDGNVSIKQEPPDQYE